MATAASTAPTGQFLALPCRKRAPRAAAADAADSAFSYVSKRILAKQRRLKICSIVQPKSAIGACMAVRIRSRGQWQDREFAERGCVSFLRRDPVLGELLAATQQGCDVSFEQLYRLTSVHLLRVVLRINRHGAEAEEVLQEVYASAWGNCNQFDRNRGNAMTWLTSIAHNKAIGSLRRRQVRPEGHIEARRVDSDSDPFESMPSAYLQPPEQLAEFQTVCAVQVFLDSLPHDHRTSLMLAFSEGLTHAEIACRLNKPLGTVKSWVRRALVAMRPALAAHYTGHSQSAVRTRATYEIPVRRRRCRREPAANSGQRFTQPPLIGNT